jgi:hypothetical protein
VDLTAEGPTDWVHWGETPVNRRAGGGLISEYTPVGSAPVFRYDNDLRAMGWSDGTPAGAMDGNSDGVFTAGVGNGFQWSVPADATLRTVLVHVGGYFSGGTLTAHLSDASAADWVDVTPAVAGQYDRNYTIRYAAGGGGQTLVLRWVQSSGTGNVTLNGVALADQP